MNTKLYLFLLVQCLMLIAESSRSEWNAVCRPAADVRALAFSGDTLFGAGSKERISFTTDSGETWTHAKAYGDNHTFYALSFFPEVSLLGTSAGEIRYAKPHDLSQWRDLSLLPLALSAGTDDILAFAESRGKAGVRFLAGGFGGGIRISIDTGKTWVASNNGLTNTNVTSLVSGHSLPDSNGQVIFAGTYGDGIFASTDNGQTWAPKSQGLSAPQVNAMKIAGDHLYVAGSGGKVCRSSDWGESWQQIGTGLPETELLCLTRVNDGSNDWIYCGTIDAGVWRCPAAGGSWTPMNTGLLNLRINSIVERDGGLYIGTHQGVCRSRNWGLSWALVGDLGSSRLAALHATLVSASTGKDLIVAGTTGLYFRGNAYWGVAYSTEDGGLNWGASANLFNSGVATIADRDELLFLLPKATDVSSGLHISTDKGITWVDRSYEHHVGFLYCSGLVIVPRRGDNHLDCFISSSSGPGPGVFFSSDTGRSWVDIRNKYTFAMGSIDSFLIMRDNTGIFKTSDYGVTWNDITPNLSGNLVTSFVNDGNRLLACISYDPANSRPGGVLMTTDAGNSWLPAGLGGKTVTSLVPIDNYLLAAADGKVYGATRNEPLWVDVTGNLVSTPLGTLTATSQTCYVLGSDGKSIWQRPMTEIIQILSSVPAPPELRFPPNGIEGCPPSAIMRWTRPAMATKFWLQVSDDSTFSGSFAVNNSSVADTFIQVEGLNFGRKYFWRVAAGNESGFSQFSTAWTLTTATVLTTPAPPTLLYPPNNTIFFTNSVKLLWHKAHPEITRYWLEIWTDSLLQNRFVDSLLVDTTRTWIWSNPYGGKFWWHVRAYNSAGWGAFSDTSVFTLSPCGVDDNYRIPSTFVLYQNFPNPFNPTTRIRFGLPTASAVNLVVYNIPGEEVRTLVNGNLAAGLHIVVFDAAELPSGLYFYRMRAGDFVETRKLLIVR
jgi:photosystem II stability/assembly factor-like uncharacterized protein